jgi:hypothetical protein
LSNLLEHFCFKNQFLYISKSELPSINSPEPIYDLVISNYAFSEFNRELQNEYLEKVILKSRSGYLLMNNGKTVNGERLLSQYGNNECITDIELLECIPGSQLITTNYLSNKGIYLIKFQK